MGGRVETKHWRKDGVQKSEKVLDVNNELPLLAELINSATPLLLSKLPGQYHGVCV